MNNLVKLITTDDGEKQKNTKWHLVVNRAGGSMAFCTGEFFGFGSSACEYEERQLSRGGITCDDCLRLVKEIKEVKI